MEIGGNTLPLFFLEPDRGVEQQFLLILLHALQPQLIADDLSLMKDDEDDKPDSQCQHTDSAKEQHQRHAATRVSDF